VHYEQAGDSGPVLLLLPGFGVGTFHFAAQLEALSSTHRVYALDFLGQAKSWPEDAQGLGFSCDLWAEQVASFVEEVIGEPAFLAGNSLGGFVATYVAATRPELVRALVLLNATPFWSNVPNSVREPSASVSWNGVLPAPWPLRALVGLWWNALRRPGTVRTLLGLVYADSRAVDDALVENILEPTRRAQAADVFVSIFLSPRAPLSFDEMLDRRTCPVCMIYGAEDPWVVPLWGQRLKRRVPEAVYYELSPAGHCPHHERPEASNTLIASYIESLVSGATELLPQTGDVLEVPLERGGSLRVTRSDGSPRNAFEVADAQAAAASADGRTTSRPGLSTMLRRLTGQE